MNDILTARIEMTTISGDIAPDLVTNLGPQGDEFKINVPQGFAARLWDFSLYMAMADNQRLGVNLMRTPVPRDGVRAWTNDNEMLDDGGVIAVLGSTTRGTSATGMSSMTFPQTEHLWDLDYRLVLNPRITGFAQVSRELGFRLRYKLVRATTNQVAAILFWQNAGEKVE